MQSHIYGASGQVQLMSIIRVTSHERINISNCSKLDCLLDSLFMPTTTKNLKTSQNWPSVMVIHKQKLIPISNGLQCGKRLHVMTLLCVRTMYFVTTVNLFDDEKSVLIPVALNVKIWQVAFYVRLSLYDTCKTR